MLSQNFNRRTNVAMEHNVTQVCLVPDLELQTYQNSRKYEKSRNKAMQHKRC